ncbi:LysE family transporter [Acinetobacter sp. NIPH 2699]|uniref:LysE family translocator n=1 Tax=Acinetobacter sp. NIPH 2699 TaxID=2923433 RepID=UPI001F4B382B|nr:LysE family transporter [Acinetobacter sp. NIPH 2699]MCH7335104.1 LysE family transporter [Acinetobacter sp. NIPH 2699]
MEHFTQTTTYIVTLALAAILPGPGMTGLMFKTLVQGYKNGLMMLFGLITGDIIFLLTSIFLISYIHHFSPHFAFYLILLSSSYLLYLAYKFWFFEGNLLGIETPSNIKETIFSYKDGLLITLSNPKTISFYLAIVPAIFGAQSLQKQGLFLVAITILTLALIGGLYVFFSWNLKKVLSDIKIQTFLLRALSLMMCILALGMLYREFSTQYLT